jgi:1-acyl-sn-glycerol-3-phosphate acyltransferase
MLYAILKQLFRITFTVFFRRAYRSHPEYLPEKGALIICANHPGAFLDPVVIAAMTNRKLFFLAKGAVFKGKFAKWFLPRLNMIPVYRQQDDPSQMHKNQETFARCFDHLGKGGTILIFPEGISITERKLKPLKTGAARIALGAEEKFNYALDVKIACIGLNYEDPHTFRRDVYVGFAEPIRVADYVKQYRENNFAAVEALTDEIRKRLEEQMINTADEETDKLVGYIERLYKEDLLREQGIDASDKPQEFRLTKRIVSTVNYFREHDPERVARISQDIKSYFWKLDELGLSDRVLRSGYGRPRLWVKSLGDLLYIVLGFPVYLYGLLHNYLPFISASLLSKKLVKSREFRGAIGAAAGMIFYLIWYVALGILSWHYFHKWGFTRHPGYMFLLYFITWPASGMFAWFYYRIVYYISKRWLMISLFFRRSLIVAELVMQRRAIIAEFEKAIRDRGEFTD